MLVKIYGARQRIQQYRNSGDEFGKVFMFHQVNDNVDLWESPNFAMKKSSFELLIDKLISEGYRFISPDDIENHLDEKSILLTFDDPFCDGMEYGASHLLKRGIPFTVFISEVYIGKENYISSEQLELLKKENKCTLGSHCIRHTVLRKLNHIECRREIIESKKRLGNLTGKEIKFLAYPYGSIYAVGKREQSFAKEAGYKLAFSTMQVGLNRRSIENRFFLPRYNVNDYNFKGFIDVK